MKLCKCLKFQETFAEISIEFFPLFLFIQQNCVFETYFMSYTSSFFHSSLSQNETISFTFISLFIYTTFKHMKAAKIGVFFIE